MQIGTEGNGLFGSKASRTARPQRIFHQRAIEPQTIDQQVLESTSRRRLLEG
jgi:hypothetical protein